jgi:EAL domain-containing protein (putative c-di-GMP-specific phosphodiesterase class I)
VDYEELIKLSQFALSQAKKAGRNQVYFFEESDYEKFLRSRMIISSIRESVGSNYEGFEVYYQPIVRDSDDEYPDSAEALLRYTLASGERISPMEFIPLLEESGLIIPVGKWVLKRAMSFCQKVQETIPDFSVNVNVSYVQVLKSQFIVEFFKMLKEHGMSPSSITIELTESGELDDTIQIHKIWNNLRQYGVTIALDDFGTGYSNLRNISDMTPNVVKLDRGFTIKALKNDFEKSLMENLIQLVHSLGLKICVEGVETEEELTRIRALDPDYMYGSDPVDDGWNLDRF